MKPKINRAGDTKRSSGFDRCNTPAYALDPLLPYLVRFPVIWEPAAGTGNIMRAIAPPVSGVIASDIHGDYAKPPRNFFDWQPPIFNAIVTNPPYSIKFDWLKRCYELGRPFALLVPVETIGAQKAQRLMEKHGVELLLLNRRVNFEMPNKGLESADGWKSSAQFPVLWLCWQMLPHPIVYGKISHRHANQSTLFDVLARPGAAG
jgi:hypothetical protein